MTALWRFRSASAVWTIANAAAIVVERATGATKFEDTTSRSLGTPTVAGGFAIFPWDGQNLSIIDAAQGAETARISNCEDFVSHALREGGAVYYGGPLLYRMTAGSASGRREGAESFAFAREDLPGRPHLLPSGYLVSYAGVNARERTAVIVRADPANDGVHLVDDTVYLMYHRAIVAFDAHTGAVRWAFLNAVDMVGAEPARGALLAVDAGGGLVAIGAQHGNVLERHALGGPVAQAAIQVPIDFAVSHDHSDPEAPPEAALTALARVVDERLTPVRVIAVHALALIAGVEATRSLVTIASDPAVPDEVRAAAGDGLSGRTDGVRVMLDALDTHYDYYRRTVAPPVGVLARALAAVHEHRAVTPHIANLQDPYTPANQLKPIVAALRDLGDPTVIPALVGLCHDLPCR